MKEDFIVNSTSEDMLLMLIFPKVEKIIGERYEKQSGKNVSWNYGRVHSVDFVIGKDDVWYEMEMSLLIGESVKRGRFSKTKNRCTSHKNRRTSK